MNIGPAAYQNTVRFTEPAAAQPDTTGRGGNDTAVRPASVAPAETSRPVEGNERGNETRAYRAEDHLGSNLDIEV